VFTSYLKSAVRNLIANKMNSAINILSLSIGLASCILISLFVRYEFSYESTIPEADSIYRLSPDFAQTETSPERHPAGNVAPIGPIIARADISGIDAVTRIGGMHATISREDDVSYEPGFRWADTNFFTVFDLEWVSGNPDTALLSPDSMVISESLALRYFGTEDPIGQTLRLENQWDQTITGVIRDIPENTHLSADLIVSIEKAWDVLGFNYENNWSYPNFHTYIKLDDSAEITQVAEQLGTLVSTLVEDSNASRFGISSSSFGLTYYNIRDIHLESVHAREFKDPGSLTFVLGFSTVAACLLLIACFNFMNLALAASMRRAKEVGMRKVIGAEKLQLVSQFMGETLLTTVLALGLALALVEAIRPTFSALMLRPLELSSLLSPGVLLFTIVTTLLTACVAGSYPALHLSRLNPAQIFRKPAGKAKGLLSLRNLLITAQFTLAIVLMIATSVVYFQLRHVQEADLGFNKEQVVVLWGSHADGLGEQWDILKNELREHPQITHVTEADMYPGSVFSRRVRVEGTAMSNWNVQAKEIGFGFFDTYDIALISGRDFNETIAGDVFIPPVNVPDGQPTAAYILNETAVATLGLAPEEVLGRQLDVDFSFDFSLAVSGPIIGVVEDIHIESLRRPIQPLVYFVPAAMWGDAPRFDVASVRIRAEDAEATVQHIRERWNDLIPEIAFDFHFLETEFELLYQDETRQGNLFTLFAGLTLVVACLGLFGLVSLAIVNRRKEIGVRKVVGSSAWNILLLLSSDFSRLVLIANVIAWPIAYVLVSQWLQTFAYRIDLTPLIFLGSGMMAFSVAWATVCSSAVRAALENPVLALRYE